MRIFLLLSLLLTVVPCFPQSGVITEKKGKYIYKTKSNWLFRPRYDSIRAFSEGRAAVMKKGKWGFIDEKGKHASKIKYDAVTDFSGGIAAVQTPQYHHWTTRNIKGEDYGYWFDTVRQVDSIIIGLYVRRNFNSVDTEYTVCKYPGGGIVQGNSMVRSGNTFLIVLPSSHSVWENYKSNTVAQLINTNGTILTDEFFTADSIFLKPTVVTTVNKPRVQAVINRDGTLSPWYHSVVVLDTGYYAVDNGSGKGVMNSGFKINIPLMYRDVRKAGENFILGKESVYFLADTTSKQLSAEFEAMNYLNEGFCAVKNKTSDTDMQLINLKGELLPGKYFYVFPFSDGLARVINPDSRQYAYINFSGRQVTPWYQRKVEYVVRGGGFLQSFFGGLVSFITMGLIRVGDGSDPDLPPFPKIPGYDSHYEYFYGTDFKNGVAITTVKRKPERYENVGPGKEIVNYGVIDTTGAIVLKHQYREINHGDSMLYVQDKDENRGLTNLQGKTILPVKYKSIEYLSGSYYRVGYTFDDGLCRINGDTGVFLTDIIYSDISDGGDSLFMVGANSKTGFIDYTGKVVIPLIYGHASPFENGKAKVGFDFIGGEEFYINRKGERVYTVH